MTKTTQKPYSNEYSFLKGFGQIERKNLRRVRTEIMEAIGISSKRSWYHRLRGQVEPRFTEIKAIEDVFAKYGITEVWGTIENK
jgi:hypothetical protein